MCASVDWIDAYEAEQGAFSLSAFQGWAIQRRFYQSL